MIKDKLSVVIPVYQAENIISELIRQLNESLREIVADYEIILIEDYSPDNSWLIIEKECEKSNKIKGIKLSRNFGQHNAIYSGLCNVKGEWIVVMDCDLQDKPREIIKLYEKALEGYDVVLAERVVRKDNFFKRLSSFLFYSVLGYLTGIDQNHKIGNFGIYKRSVIDAILKMNDYRKYFPAMINWVGFKKTTIEVSHGDRYEGQTSYNFVKLLGLAINTLISFSDRLLRLVIGLGLIISILSVIAAIILFVKYYRGEIEVAGYSSIMISVWFLSGIVITVMGVVGIYIGKIFDQGKGRPVYIVEKIINLEDKKTG